MLHRCSRLVLLAAFVVTVLTRCAHQVSPGGGAEDKTPPAVLSSDPAQAETTVSLDREITFSFSEWIDPRSATRSVAMFPPPPGGYAVVVRGRSLVIRPETQLADSTTYHIELTNALKDLRGNPLGKPRHLVFSTGDALDSGRVSGCVIDPATRILQPRVVLFRTDSAHHDTVLFGEPTYLTQTDSGGRFSLEHIRPGRYELLAFDDANEDNRLQAGREATYAAVERTITVGPGDARHVLYPVLSDTTSRRVVSCTPVSRNRIAGQWSRKPPLDAADSAYAAFRIAAADSSPHEPAIERVVELSGGLRFNLVLAEPLRLRQYRLYYEKQPIIAPPDTVSLLDSLRFNGVTFADTIPPSLVSSARHDRTDLEPRLLLAWSEPVRIAGGELAFGDTLGDTVRFIADSAFADSMIVEPARRLGPGRVYRARLPFESVADLSGNHPARSVDTLSPTDTSEAPDTAAVDALVLTVSTIAADSIAVSLSGGADCLDPSPSRWWQFRPMNGDRRYTTRDNGGSFRFDSIPGARGFLSLFDDQNGDGEHRFGELTPWTPPEPYVPFYDTVEARTRWDIEGVTPRACDPCDRGQLDHMKRGSGK